MNSFTLEDINAKVDTDCYDCSSTVLHASWVLLTIATMLMVMI